MSLNPALGLNPVERHVDLMMPVALLLLADLKVLGMLVDLQAVGLNPVAELNPAEAAEEHLAWLELVLSVAFFLFCPRCLAWV